uniref:ribosomal protein S1 n=1 Tax=Porphyridium aerugineum TaxID=2792 RepID=UPI001FCCE6CE|nr:ribosomal protein S1 [Porphyridium aerugineum]UNJ17851.1 ribosomal protein S1 [Porphyridium aerugineum]
MVKNNKYALINFKDRNFVQLIKQYEYNFHSNDIIAGKIISLEVSGMLVDIGSIRTGFLPFQELSYNLYAEILRLEINQIREFLILKQLNVVFNQNLMILSIYQLDAIRVWKRLKVMDQEDVILQTNMLGYNKGGALVALEGLIGFIPKSHLPFFNDKMQYLSQLPVTILEANKQKNILTLSTKCALLRQNLNEFKIGKQIEGTIQEIKPYGICISINHLMGLLHQSEIPKNQEIDRNFHVGQKLQVKILHVDIKYGRIFFSLKNLN